jgi:hypothetical protein
MGSTLQLAVMRSVFSVYRMLSAFGRNKRVHYRSPEFARKKKIWLRLAIVDYAVLVCCSTFCRNAILRSRPTASILPWGRAGLSLGGTKIGSWGRPRMLSRGVAPGQGASTLHLKGFLLTETLLLLYLLYCKYTFV